DDYTFQGLPLPDIDPGTSLLVSGPTHGGVRDLASRMIRSTEGEGSIVVTTNKSAERLVRDYQDSGVDIGPDTLSIVDCTDGSGDVTEARVLSVSGPADLTGIGIRFSDAYRQFDAEDVERVRTGVFSLSTLLSFSDLRTVSRFVHTLAGRIGNTGGIGLFLIDPGLHDERTIRTVGQFCDGRIEVRDGADGPELRTRGIPDDSRYWRAFDTKP
ncbi:MAG: hypothetical protein ACI8U4_002780, partial [Natronomonas sp.]